MLKKKCVLTTFFAVGTGLLFLSGFAGNWQTQAIPTKTDNLAALQPTGEQAAQAMERLPLYFIENRGQADPRARFTLRGGGRTVHLTDSGLLFDFLRYEKMDREQKRGHPDRLQGRRLVVGLDFSGANPQPEISGQTQKSARFHYLIGNDRSKWVTDVPAFGAVVYRDVYPGVDLRLYDDGGVLRYDFIVRPGGRVADIRLDFRGIDGLRLDKGELVAATEFGEIRQSEPVIYQETSQGRTNVSGGFALEGPSRFAFKVGAYDRSRPLVIDPQVMTLGYSTFLGGGSDEQANDINWDSAYVFVTGYTDSAGFPATSGAYDTVLNNRDAFVAKIDPAASGAASLVWCTFIGGSANDSANGIDVNGNEAYIVGETFSSDFPVVNQGTLNYNNSADIFVTRLNSAGNGLITSVCMGTFGADWGNDISVAGPVAVWICGVTASGSAFYGSAINRQEHGPLGFADAFMVQVDTATTPAFPAYVMVFGGTGGEEALAIDQDGSRIYLTGYTSSTDFPVSAGAYQSTYQGSLSDAFVFKSDFGGALIYSTYLGTSLPDRGTGIAIGSGGAYVCGYCYDAFPAGFASNGFDNTRTHNPGYPSGFMARIHDDGASLDYSTYIESDSGPTNTYARAIRSGGTSRSDCWVTGDTGNTMYGIPAKNYYQDLQSGKDAFVARYDTSASGADSCLFVTHLGGGGNDEGRAVAGYLGSVVTTGWTDSGTFPVSASAYDATHNGAEDVFVSILSEPPLAATTGAATNVYSTSATLNASLTSKSGVPSVSMRFEYSTVSGGPYSALGADTVSAAVPYAYSKAFTGLTPATTYYYRILAYHSFYENAYGSELSFTTPAAAAPTVTTTAASAVTASSASSGGNVTAMGSDPVTARGVCWNTGGTPTTADSHTTNGSGTGTFTSSLTGLSAGTLYSVRAYATSIAGTAYGNEVTFTTLQLPTVTTQAVTSIAATTASGNGNITDLGIPNPTAHGVCWNTAGTPTLADGSSNRGAASSTGAFNTVIAGLTANTLYYVRAFATNSVGTAYGSQVSFTSLAIAPTVTTQAVTAITATGATGNGNITSLGVPNPTAHGVCWNTSGTPTTADNTTNLGAASATGAFTSAITGLSAGTTYHVRAYATNTAGTSYGSEVTFSTLEPPTVTTQAVTAITATSATGNGNITDLGNPNPTAHGVCWNTAGTPTTAGSHSDDGAASSTGAFTSLISGLSANTTYYVRTYATNAAGTSYGNQVSFTSLAIAPTVTTQAATSISTTGAIGNGNITSLGVPNPTAHGVCWNTAGTPTTADNTSNLGAAASTGAFTTGISGLTAGTTYHVRAYATNSAGTAYGGEVTFISLPAAPVATTATNMTGSSFQANWNAATSATGYRLDVATDSGFTSFVSGYNNLDVGNVTLRAVNGLSAGTHYYYRLRAYNISGTSANSNWIDVITVPATPLATAATVITVSGFTANFNAVTGASDYYLDVATDSGFTSYVPGFHDRDIGLTSYPLTGLTAGTAYYYRVRAYNSSGVSDYSNTISVLTLPDAPVATAATNVTSSSFQANWSAVLSATSYRLDVSTSNTFASYVSGYQDLDVGNVTSHTVTGLAPNTMYYYRLRAVNPSGSSADSNVISLTTLQSHTVRFTCTAGGRLLGSLTQTVDHGGDCTPVTAQPDPGYRFIEWNGNGGFWSLKNPLTVNNVDMDMTIRASFVNNPPTIRIVNPLHNANVWGLVNIRAEVTDDLALSAIEFFVDGARPASAGPASTIADGSAAANLQLESGDLYLDFRGADLLLVDSQLHLRKLGLQGGLQPVIGADLPLRELALAGPGQVHLLFAEPQRLADGRLYSWVLCDLGSRSVRGIEGDPARLPYAFKTPALQFDAAGNGYYFTNANAGAVALLRRAADKVDELYAAAGQQVRDWLVLPDGTVLLSLFRPETERLDFVKVAADGQPVRHFSGGFAALLQPAAAAGVHESAASDFFRVSGGRLLASGNAVLARNEWPSPQWEKFNLSGIEVADMASDAGGNLFVAGREPLSGRFGLWSVAEGGWECLAYLPAPSLRIAVLQSRADGARAEIGADLAFGLAAAITAVSHSCDWNTLLYANGLHKISAVARDEAGAEARDEIVVNVANVILSLECQRFTDHAWLITKNYVKIQLAVDNNVGAPVAKYVVYRRIDGGNEQVAKEFLANEVQDGRCELIEPTAGGTESIAYRAVALTADGMIVGISAVTII